MRSSKEVLIIQKAIPYRIVRLISRCRFFPCITQRIIQTDNFGAEYRPLIAGQLIAVGDACVYVQSDFLFPPVISILHN